MTLEQRKTVVGLPPKRGDIILYGLDILALLTERFAVETLMVSDAGLLDGVMLAQDW